MRQNNNIKRALAAATLGWRDNARMLNHVIGDRAKMGVSCSHTTLAPHDCAIVFQADAAPALAAACQQDIARCAP